MGLTNFPNGITSFGVPILSGSVLPSTQGNVWHVRPSNGSNSNDGKSPSSAFNTVAYALAAATANQNDIILLYAEGNASGATTDYQSATLLWNKDLVHLIGVCAPSAYSQRARIAQLSTATGISPLVNVTANGCIFANVSFFHGVADATSLVCLQVTGQRNYFKNCHIAGIGNATQVTAGAASLKLAAASENVFEDCVIGLDTISRDNTTNGEIWCTAAATRNLFKNCTIDAYVSNAGYVHVTIGANGIDRTLEFESCLFMAKSSNKAITQTSVMSIPAISQGAIVLKNSMCFSDGGATDWDSNNRGIIWNNQVAAAASAGGGILTNQ